jgi:hypothetical protein
MWIKMYSGMRRILCIGWMICISWGLYAQLSLGLINGNYSGSSSLAINPSLMANSKLKSDINLFSISAFAENNYLYFPAGKSNLVQLFNGVYDYHFFPKPYGEGERNVYSYYDDKSKKFIFGNVRIIGPSVMFSVHDHIFAVRTGFRTITSTRRLPYDMANFSYYGMDFTPQQNVFYSNSNYDMASMGWWDIMFSYATVFNRSHNNHWSAGISIGPVFGYSGAYLTGGDTRYIAYNDSILNVDLLDAEFGISLPLEYETDEVDFFHPLIRGFGWGMDVGITWQYRERPYQKKFPGNFYNKRFEDYKFKVGLSVLDIGWVNFTKNAERHVYDQVYNNSINVSELEYVNIRHELDTTSIIFYGDPDSSLQGDRIRIYMPTSISVQFDYHIADWWYVNTTLIIPAVYKSPMIEMPVVWAVTPRFESRMIEISVPLVLYDYKYPRVGLAIRLEGLTVGTDNLGGFIGKDDFTGADIYISYKINLRNNGKSPYTSKGACYNNWRLELKRMHQTRLQD